MPSFTLVRRAFSDGARESNGAKLFLGSPVTRIEQGSIRTADGNEIMAKHIVNAAGANAAELSPGIEINKRKGHLIITDRYPGFVSHQLVELGYLKSAHSTTEDSVAFNVQPRKTGQVLIGSSRQYGAEDKEIDSGILARMVRRAAEYMPGLGALLAIRIWSGFRAATPDKLPLIGPSPRIQQYIWRLGMKGWELPRRWQPRGFWWTSFYRGSPSSLSNHISRQEWYVAKLMPDSVRSRKGRTTSVSLMRGIQMRLLNKAWLCSIFFCLSILPSFAQQNLAATPPMGWNSWNHFASR